MNKGAFLIMFDTSLQTDINLIHEIEADLGKQMDKFECKENEVLADITKVRYFSDAYWSV